MTIDKSWCCHSHLRESWQLSRYKEHRRGTRNSLTRERSPPHSRLGAVSPMMRRGRTGNSLDPGMVRTASVLWIILTSARPRCTFHKTATFKCTSPVWVLLVWRDPGRPPKWVVKLLEPSEDEPDQSAEQPDQSAEQPDQSAEQPEQSAEQPESENIGGRMQSTRQSGRYPLRRRVAPPDRYQ